MWRPPAVGLPVIAVILWTVGACTSGPVAPGCNERQAGTLIDATTTVAPSAAVSYEVTSPVNSNLFFTVVWNDAAVDLGQQATTLACGVHVGCDIGDTVTARRTPQPKREMQLDGSLGKRYRIDVLGDVTRAQLFTLRVSFDTGICT